MNHKTIKARIMELLSGTCPGLPMKKEEILRELGLDDTYERTVRRIISEEIMLEMPIGSHSNGNAGYFLIGADLNQLKAPDMEDTGRAVRILQRRNLRRDAWEKYWRKSAAAMTQPDIPGLESRMNTTIENKMLSDTEKRMQA